MYRYRNNFTNGVSRNSIVIATIAVMTIIVTAVVPHCDTSIATIAVIYITAIAAVPHCDIVIPTTSVIYIATTAAVLHCDTAITATAAATQLSDQCSIINAAAARKKTDERVFKFRDTWSVPWHM